MIQSVQTKRIIGFGKSWAVTLNKNIMRRKGFNIGDIVKVTIEPQDDTPIREAIFAEVASEEMKKANVKELTIKMDDGDDRKDENENTNKQTQ